MEFKYQKLVQFISKNGSLLIGCKSNLEIIKEAIEELNKIEENKNMHIICNLILRNIESINDSLDEAIDEGLLTIIENNHEEEFENMVSLTSN